MLNPFEIKKALDGMEIIVDTREQDTIYLRARLRQMACPVRRAALSFGDYSARFPLPDGAWLDLSNLVAVERKMDLGELAACFGTGRRRFKAEFERARAMGARLYLLVENASFEQVYSGKYRSRMNSPALLSSILAWLARYNCQLLFCSPKITGRLIKDILYREGKEILEKGGATWSDGSG